MNASDMQRFKDWFAEYIKDYYGDDEYVNEHLKHKEKHTYRVCEEMDYITGKLGLCENDCLIAEAIALFHDVGRFPQFVQYRTYNDVVSVKHGQLSVLEVKRSKIMSGLADYEQKLIIKAIALHSVKEVPDYIDERVILFSKLIRDADKLDIYRLLIQIYTAYHKDPESFIFDMELPDDPTYTDEIVEAAIKGELIDYRALKTLNDIKILKVGWVHDINFAPALKRIKELEYVESLFGFLPDDDRMTELKRKTLDYMDRRIKNNE